MQQQLASRPAARLLGCAPPSVTRCRLLACRPQAQASSGAAPVSASPAAACVPSLPHSEAPVLVWLKRDLRLDDHPGLLAAAASGSPVIPYFCLDPALFSYLALIPGGPAALHAALTRLRGQLRAAGSDLVVRVGPAYFTTAAFAGLAGAGRIVLEREEESSFLEAAHRLAQQMDAIGVAARMTTWQAPLWDSGSFKPNFKDWLAARGAPLEPLPPPTTLPRLPDGIEPGHLPELASPAAAEQLAAMVASGEEQPEQLLRAYLEAEGTPSNAQLRWLSQSVAALEQPSAPGASFPALMGPLVGLGVLSSRAVYKTALATETARWGGRLPLFGPASVTAKAAIEACELCDFHRQLAGHVPQEGEAAGGASASASASWADSPVSSAFTSFEEAPDGVEQWGFVDWPKGVPKRVSWRWRGAMTDFCVIEPTNPKPNAPALVLVHGFGAFGDQWRFNLAPLAEAGYTVYAPTLPGFGRSEKAALQYSQNAWRDFVRDFLVCVVRRPAVLAGNSIGGFISASAAADYPQLVAGLVLVNSAGPITPGVTAADIAAAAAQAKKPPAPWVVKLTTFGLMQYLQRSIAKQLKWLYPTNPDNADAWLEREIYRAACDSRSPSVFASVFYLPKPRPLNWLINECWAGPTAVIQGVLDPLNDALGRLRQLEALCPGLAAYQLQGGHCPHDELPEQFNAAMLDFVERRVLPAAGQQAAAGRYSKMAPGEPRAASQGAAVPAQARQE